MYLYLFAVIFFDLAFFYSFHCCRGGTRALIFIVFRRHAVSLALHWHLFADVSSLLDHISYGCGLFWAIGYYLFPGSFTGIYFINLLLSLAAFFFMTYDLLKNVVPAAHKMVLALGTL